VLVEHEVAFIVVGGVSAVLQGAPTSTFDLDIVHSREAGNLHRLLSALAELDAYYRIQPERRLKPVLAHLSSAGHQLLMTRFGPLDLLGTIGRGLAYDDLIEHATDMQLGRKLRISVLKLRKLIEVKEAVAGEKDKAVLPILRRTLREKEKPG
jgi:hypothetical protein